MTKSLPPGLPPPFEFVREYKAPEPSRVDSLDGLLRWADTVACADQDAHGEARSMWIFMQDGHCMGILHTPFIDPVIKDVSFALVRGILRNVPITHYAFINEMFYVDVAKHGWDGKTAPSQHPRRMDGLLISAHARGGDFRTRTYRISYDRKRRPTRHNENIFANIGEPGGSGPAFNLFAEEIEVGNDPIVPQKDKS